MAKRLRNNLSKRRTRKNTLRRKRRKKYTKGGKPLPFFGKKRGTTDSSSETAGQRIMRENTELKDEKEQYISVLKEKNTEIQRLTQKIIDLENIMRS